MFKYGFGVELIGEDANVNGVIDALYEALKDLTDTGVMCRVKYNGSKKLSEQGFKVSRARCIGQTVAMVGDGHKGDVAEEVLANAD